MTKLEVGIQRIISKHNVQKWDDSQAQEIHPGDVVWIPSGEKHWHGATATTAMTHIAIQEHLDGKTADWMEKVSKEHTVQQKIKRTA